jgi:hypothetical protein
LPPACDFLLIRAEAERASSVNLSDSEARRYCVYVRARSREHSLRSG